MTCRYQNGAQLLDLCAEADMFPCMFLRRLLEQVPWTCNKNVRQVNIAYLAVLPVHLCFLECCTTARLLCALIMPVLTSLYQPHFLMPPSPCLHVLTVNCSQCSVLAYRQLPRS